MHTNRLVCSDLRCLVASVLLFAAAAGAGQAAETHNYETSFSTIAKLSHDVCSVMDPKIRRTLSPQPLLFGKMAQPYFQPVEYFDGTNKFRLVALSEGALELLNGFAHARALNNVEPGSLAQYLTVISAQEEFTPLLCLQAGERRQLAPLSGAKEKVWGFETMNSQISQFNQIAGALLAINLAHHYLGHYQKYASRLTDAQNRPVPICSLVTPGEWREAVNKGAKNAMQCGLGLNGIKGFYDALGQIQTRPAWALNFLPQEANVGKIKKDLDRIEGSFFLSEK